MLLVCDSIGKLKVSRSGKPDYTEEVARRVASDANIEVHVKYRPGEDLEAVLPFEEQSMNYNACIVLMMANRTAKTLENRCVETQLMQGVESLARFKCPVKVVYGGPEDFWFPNSVQDLVRFDEKVQVLRDRITQLGIDCDTGKDQLRNQFSCSDFDYMGHFLGRTCRDRAVAWMCEVILSFTDVLWKASISPIPIAC